MIGFADYLVSNWIVDTCVGIEKKYSHSMKVSVDKKTEREKVDHNIVIGLKFYNKDNVLLKSESIKFVNNELCTASKKKMVNISPDELTNRFMNAKREIVGWIMNDYRIKIGEIEMKVHNLSEYEDVDSLGCNAEFKGERIELGKKIEKKNKKAVFDM